MCIICTDERALYMYRRTCVICTDECSLYAQTNVHYMFRRMCITCTDECALSVHYVYERMYIICTNECALYAHVESAPLLKELPQHKRTLLACLISPSCSLLLMIASTASCPFLYSLIITCSPSQADTLFLS